MPPEDENTALYVDEGVNFSVQRDQEIPTPADDEILIETQFSGTNPADIKHATLLGIYPAVLGYDFCGTVLKAPPSSAFQPGDLVAGYTPTGINRPPRYGTHQRYLACPEDMVFPVPAALPPHHAASLTVVAMTAADAIFNIFNLPLPRHDNQARTTKPLLIWGASSSVGLCALQLARASGIHPIIVTASPERHSLLQELGATRCFDYKSSSVISDIKATVRDSQWGPLTCGFDAVGSQKGGVGSAQLVAECCSEDATLVSVVVQSDSKFKMPIATPNMDVVIKVQNVPFPITIPARPAGYQRAWCALTWAVENYGVDFRLPSVDLFEGTAEEALEELKAIADGGRCVKRNIQCAFPKAISTLEDPPLLETPEFIHSTLLLDDNPTLISSGSGDHATFDEHHVRSFEDLAATTRSDEQHREDLSMYLAGHPGENAIHPHVLSLPSQGLGDAMAVDMSISLPSGGSVTSISTREDNDELPSSQSDFSMPEEPHAHRFCCTLFPETRPDEDVIAAENCGHVRPIADNLYRQICDFWKSQQCSSCASPFISLSFLNAMVQLYFEHHDPWMSFIHPSSFDTEDASWVLILAVASIGCQYSNVERSELYVLGLQDLLQKALPKDATETIALDQMTLAQCLLLRNTALLFSGYEDEILTSQYQRNMLTSVAKSVSANVAESIPSLDDLDPYERWRRWVGLESQRRVVYCIYVIECCYWIFKDAPSSMTLDDFKIALPCRDKLWTSNFEQWQECLPTRPESKDRPSLKTAFSNPDLLDNLLNDNSGLSNLVILLTFNVEERRLLRSTQPWFAADMATGLNERKLYKWPDELVSFRTALDDKCDPTIKRFSMLTPIVNNAPTFLKVMFHVTNILRRTPLRCLYALSGWQVTVDQMTAAATSLSHWMQQNPTLAREALLQATTLFGVLYDETTGPGSHHLAFLTAGLYIWAYCIVGGEDSATGANGTRKISQRPLRPDKGVPDDVKNSWIQSTLEAPVYVKGVGILNGPESAIRVLKGFRLALSSHRSWPSLRHGLIYSISEVIDGRFASLSPELKSSGWRKNVDRETRA
ncbi:hypothetical protein AKAW_03266 [Aspergillus niger]|uniref:Enoyl reductase (ER) domain-containing protein n=1 Tax=Aspergillus niger TaxID=5061 RepID=A0A100ILE2_ASPNG|nr:hypothetical protein AKAW_03266 [Aspergillus niger]